MTGDYPGSGEALLTMKRSAAASRLALCHMDISSRKLERATHDSMPFGFIVANQHFDHNTIATTPHQ